MLPSLTSFTLCYVMIPSLIARSYILSCPLELNHKTQQAGKKQKTAQGTHLVSCQRLVPKIG